MNNKVLCNFCKKPIHIDDAMLETGGGKKGHRFFHIKCRVLNKKNEK